MTDHIESPTVIKRCLGEHLAVIKRLDPLSKHRADTGRFRHTLLRAHGPRCGYHLEELTPEQLETAHIIPLEIGGQSRPRKSTQDDKWSFCLTAGTL